MNEYLLVFYRIAVLMLIYSILRVSFYLFNLDTFQHISSRDFALILCGGLRFDISALAYLNTIFIFVYTISFRGKYRPTVRRATDAIFFCVNGLGIATNCIDFVYYRFILKRTTFNVLEVIKNEDNMGALWLQFLIDYWYILLYYVLIMTAFVWLVRRARPCPTAIRSRGGYVCVGVVALLLYAGLSTAAIRGGFLHSTRPIRLNNAVAYTHRVEESAIVLNTPFSILRTIGKRSYPRREYMSDEKCDSLFAVVKNQNLSDSTKTELKRMNVVVIILESFGREFVGSLNPELDGGNYRGYTPFLDSLSQRSLVFGNAYANGRKSIDAMPSILASVPSLTLPYIVSEYCNNRVNSLASLLGDEGYTTAFYHGAPNGSMGFDAFANTAGFESYFGKTEYANDADYDGIWGIWDHAFFLRFAEEIGALREPFVASMFSLSSHHPFKVPREYEGVFPKGQLPLHQCIGYSDYALKLFFEKACQMPWFERTLFVLVADHANGFAHEEYNNELQSFAVPIFFYAPSDTALRGRDDRLAQQTDIMPTVLSYLNYTKPYVAFGCNLLNDSEERFVVNCHNDVYQIASGDTVMYFDGEQVVGLYNYRYDHDLKDNLLGKASAEQIEMKAKAYIQQYNNRLIDNNLTVK